MQITSGSYDGNITQNQATEIAGEAVAQGGE